MITVMIADDQALFRKSLGQLLDVDETINVIKLVENGKQAVEQCALLKPDIIMLDIEMPVMDGITALSLIKKDSPNIKVIILTTFNLPEQIESAFLADADGFVSKDVSPQELLMTINCVYHGLTVVDKNVKRLMMDYFTEECVTCNYNFKSLTEEEIDIVKLIVNGKTNKEIAKKLNYSEGTIKNKVSKLYDKLGINDRLQLAVCALENGLA